MKIVGVRGKDEYGAATRFIDVCLGWLRYASRLEWRWGEMSRSLLRIEATVSLRNTSKRCLCYTEKCFDVTRLHGAWWKDAPTPADARACERGR